MENLLQEQIAPPLKKSVKVKQIAAAIFFIIALIIPCIEEISIVLFRSDFLYDYDINSKILYIHVIDISSYLLYTIGFIILSTIPLNRPTKLMMYTLIGIKLLLGIASLLSLFPAIDIIQFLNKTSNPIPIYYISIIGCLYAYSIIIKNNSISQNSTKWINILCIATIINLCRKLYFTFVRTWLMESFSKEYFYGGFIGLVFSYIWLILIIVAYVEFCRCEAFDGNPDTNGYATVSYSPLNKYTASLFITTAVIIGTLIAYYKFIAPELMNLNI